jgi:pantoate--beta-alanine ligase
MQIISNISEAQNELIQLKKSGKIISFVPTMGYLHAGHMSLVELAKKQSDLVVLSIFVNPTQFGPNEDFDSYPRNLENDIKLCQEYGVNILFTPYRQEMYPVNFQTKVLLNNLPNVLCGLSRPGHFDGVAQVVLKLFNIVQCDFAFFGSKDYQQVQIIKQMVIDLNLPVKIISAPIKRENDGLAMSSRNSYLNSHDRTEALILSNTLNLAKKLLKNGLTNVLEIIPVLEKNILKTNGQIDYIKIVHTETLQDLKHINDKALLALAVKFGKTRLIDNTILER